MTPSRKLGCRTLLLTHHLFCPCPPTTSPGTQLRGKLWAPRMREEVYQKDCGILQTAVTKTQRCLLISVVTWITLLGPEVIFLTGSDLFYFIHGMTMFDYSDTLWKLYCVQILVITTVSLLAIVSWYFYFFLTTQKK